LGFIDSDWVLRNDLIWQKPNCSPSSAKDRFTIDYEHIFFFTKSQKYYFQTQYEPHNPKYEFRYKSPFGGTKNKNGQGAFDYSKPRFIKPNPRGRIKRSVWDIPADRYDGAHFAVYPTKLVECIIKAGCPADGVVLDPFMGSGTTALVALQNARKFVGIELSSIYVDLAYDRLKPLLSQETLIITN
jgi:site-specific DNA-methyltransferase (adenine-specific)